jgi:hypothetical protein
LRPCSCTRTTRAASTRSGPPRRQACVPGRAGRQRPGAGQLAAGAGGGRRCRPDRLPLACRQSDVAQGEGPQLACWPSRSGQWRDRRAAWTNLADVVSQDGPDTFGKRLPKVGSGHRAPPTSSPLRLAVNGRRLPGMPRRAAGRPVDAFGRVRKARTRLRQIGPQKRSWGLQIHTAAVITKDAIPC